MTDNIFTPPLFSEDIQYPDWINEVECWVRMTPLAKKKRGMALAYKGLPLGSKIRQSVFSELGYQKLEAEDGVEQLIAYMDELYLKNDLESSREKFTNFIRYRKDSEETMEEYVLNFDRKYRESEKCDILKMGNGAKGFLLLDHSKLNHQQQQLVLTGVNYEEKEQIHEQMKSSLVKYFGKACMANRETTPSIQYKSEDAFYSTRTYSRGRPTRGNWRGHGGKVSNGRGMRKQNPEINGKVSRCIVCQSIYHWASVCPDRSPEEKIYEVSHSNSEEQELEHCNYVSHNDKTHVETNAEFTERMIGLMQDGTFQKILDAHPEPEEKIVY